MVQGPVWPNGWMEFKVRLFAEGETVVEQSFHVDRQDGQLGLVYGYDLDRHPDDRERAVRGRAVQHPRRRGDLRRGPTVVALRDADGLDRHDGS